MDPHEYYAEAVSCEQPGTVKDGAVKEGSVPLAGEHPFVTRLKVLAPDVLAQLNKAMPRDLQAKFDSSDIVQETLLEAQRNYAQFKGRTDQEFLRWLCGMFRNQFCNLVRRYRRTGKRQVAREVSLEQVDLLPGHGCEVRDTMPEPSEQAIAREEEAFALQALPQLSDREREVLYLVCRDGLKFPEIGQQLGITKGAARQRYLRALERFREVLQEISGE